ncbi:MAG: BREX-6 system BrxE protein, partial [Deltaproteobacteria bacterium]|nr:BREX-6 system BrxE protein [Deltaproteobacteria bacterium]
RTLFFFGFDLDERLAERLAEHKRGTVAPAEALPLPVSIDSKFSADGLTEALHAMGKTPAYDVVPVGRQLKAAMPDALDLAARHLVTALLPFSEQYPMPFYRVKA